ncbi:hypothetical protein [Microvirga sp. 17 mud 1-3]|uniref:hypothetical protein n=1 Tax=Microvirga sp. 17 mud 1-3 TaxID=2082949 RepID=UPI000D6CDBAD|nr:hypothetical protein [Microvirga sp. 17 mud 1-3]AWM86786.1 hypothetical protein C4E04_08665 [Microvirga sp. 17 mud 1-3]
MRKIIEGKRYDTETATRIANYNNGHSPGDFKWIEEDLYRTAKGNWFIHGAGGAMTSYSQQDGPNSWSGGQDIRVLTPTEAQEWLEVHGETTAVEEFFEVEDA